MGSRQGRIGSRQDIPGEDVSVRALQRDMGLGGGLHALQRGNHTERVRYFLRDEQEEATESPEWRRRQNGQGDKGASKILSGHRMRHWTTAQLNLENAPALIFYSRSWERQTLAEVQHTGEVKLPENASSMAVTDTEEGQESRASNRTSRRPTKTGLDMWSLQPRQRYAKELERRDGAQV